MQANADYYIASERFFKWLASQNLKTTEIKQLLKDVKSINQLTPPFTDIIKMEYLTVMNLSETLVNEIYPILLSDYPQNLWPWILYFQGEPELFFRIYGHFFANHLRYADLPKYQRPPLYSFGRNNSYLFQIPNEELLPSTLDAMQRIEHAVEISALYLKAPYLFENFMIYADRQIILQKLIETTIHLDIYCKTHGEFPERLAQAYESIEDLPIDELEPSGAVLNYVKDGPLHYRLWSVGFDGVDNGGVDLLFERDTEDLGIEMIRKP